jgi:hypothetical protein
LGQELGRISEMSDCTLYDAVRTKTMGLISVLVQCTPARESGGGALEIEGATEKRSAISSPSEGV